MNIIRVLTGKINSSQVFIGNIKRCTKYEKKSKILYEIYDGDDLITQNSVGHIDSDDEIFKANAILLKLNNGGYVDIDNILTIFDYIKINSFIDKDGWHINNIMMDTEPHSIDSLFVDANSLEPYFENDDNNKISVYQLNQKNKY